MSFTVFSRVYLRKLDRAHYANGLTNGSDRLFFARRDGEHFSDYGDKMLRRWSDDDEDACGGAGRGAHGAGAVRLSRSSSGGSGAARSAGAGAGGYAPVPDAHFGSDGDDGIDDDRPPHGLHPGVAGAYLSLEELGPGTGAGAGEKDVGGGGSAGGSSTRGSSIEEKRRAKGLGALLNGGGAGA